MAIQYDDGIYVVHVVPYREKRRADRWTVEAYFRGHRGTTRVRKACSEEQVALKLAAELWRDYCAGNLEAPDAPPVTLGELVERFASREKTRTGRELSPATARAYRSQLVSLVAGAGTDLPVHHLHERHIRALVNRQGISSRTRAQYLRAARALCRWAVAQGWLPGDVTAKVEVDPGPARMRPYLMPDEVEPFLKACAPAHRIRAGVILETGLRASEAAALRWEWVRRGLRMDAINVPATDPVSGFRSKGRRGRVIPLSKRAGELLEEAAKQWGREGFVLHAMDKHPRADVRKRKEGAVPRIDNWHRATVQACERAKVHQVGEAPGADEAPTLSITRVDTHGLRRTAGVLWLAAGVDIYTVSRWLGHASVTTTERAYADVLDVRHAEAMRQVDAARIVVRVRSRQSESGQA